MKTNTFAIMMIALFFGFGIFLWKSAEKYGIEEGIIYCNQKPQECALRYHYMKLNKVHYHSEFRNQKGR